MRVFITGASGFVGSHVVRELAAAGHQISALARAQSKRESLADLPITWVMGDVCEPASYEKILRASDAVIHTAAQVTFGGSDAKRQQQINVEGTQALLSAAARASVPRFVHTSSVAAIGHVARGITDESATYNWPPGLYYNESKRDSERVVRAEKAMTTICLNPSLVFGPGDHSARFLPLFRVASSGVLRVAPPGGTTLCDVRDIAAAHVAALTKGRSGERYILGGVHITYRDLFALICQSVGRSQPWATISPRLIGFARGLLAPLERAGIPLPASSATLAYFEDEVYYSSKKAERELDYRTRTAHEMITATATDLESRGLL